MAEREAARVCVWGWGGGGALREGVGWKTVSNLEFYAQSTSGWKTMGERNGER